MDIEEACDGVERSIGGDPDAEKAWRRVCGELATLQHERDELRARVTQLERHMNAVSEESTRLRDWIARQGKSGAVSEQRMGMLFAASLEGARERREVAGWIGRTPCQAARGEGAAMSTADERRKRLAEIPTRHRREDRDWLLAEVGRLEAYARHSDDCHWDCHWDCPWETCARKCTCGLDEVLNAG